VPRARCAPPDYPVCHVHEACLKRIKRTRESDAVTEKTEDAAVAKANLLEHLKNIDAACDDARLSAVEKIRRIKE
jgi:hypothetical protein